MLPAFAQIYAQVVEDVTAVVCSSCKEEKSRDAFHADSSTKLGIRYQCKQCVGAYLKNRLNDPDIRERKRQKSQIWASKNIDKKRESARKWVTKNPERRAKYEQ